MFHGNTQNVLYGITVSLCGVIAAKRLGAEQIIILGRRADRIALAREFGGIDVVSERVMTQLIVCVHLAAASAFTPSSNVGLEQSMRTAISIARPGGAVGRVGVLQDDESRSTAGSITVLGGKAVAKRIRNVHLADTEETESQADKK